MTVKIVRWTHLFCVRNSFVIYRKFARRSTSLLLHTLGFTKIRAFVWCGQILSKKARIPTRMPMGLRNMCLLHLGKSYTPVFIILTKMLCGVLSSIELSPSSLSPDFSSFHLTHRKSDLIDNFEISTLD